MKKCYRIQLPMLLVLTCLFVFCSSCAGGSSPVPLQQNYPRAPKINTFGFKDDGYYINGTLHNTVDHNPYVTDTLGTWSFSCDYGGGASSAQVQWLFGGSATISSSNEDSPHIKMSHWSGDYTVTLLVVTDYGSDQKTLDFHLSLAYGLQEPSVEYASVFQTGEIIRLPYDEAGDPPADEWTIPDLATGKTVWQYIQAEHGYKLIYIPWTEAGDPEADLWTIYETGTGDVIYQYFSAEDGWLVQK